MNRKRLLLFSLLVLLVLSIVYGFFRMPREQRVSALKYTTGKSAGTAKTAEPVPLDDTKVHLELLEGQQGRFTGFRKNIFRPIFQEQLKTLPPPPPPPVKKPAAGPGTKGAPVAPEEQQPPPPPPTDRGAEVVREMARFTFLGFVKSDNMKTIFLSKDNKIFLVRRGSKIEDKYEVTNITDEALTIHAIADDREMIIPLEENKPLTPARR